MAQPVDGSTAMRRIIPAAFMLMVAGLAAPAMASPENDPAHSRVVVRVGDHDGFGRLVFDLPDGATVETVAAGSRVLLVFSPTVTLNRPPGMPRNLATFQVDGTNATLTLAPGARVRSQRLGARLVLDLLDPAPGLPARKTVGPAAKGMTEQEQQPQPQPQPQAILPTKNQDTEPQRGLHIEAPVDAMPPTPRPPEMPTVHRPEPEVGGGPVNPSTQSQPSAAPVVSVAAVALPVQPAATNEVAPPPPKPFLLAADTTVGAAAFRRGTWGIVVLDRKLSITEPVSIAGAKLIPAAAATVLKVPLPGESGLAIERQSGGWSVAIVDSSDRGSLSPQPLADGVLFPLSRTGRAVTIQDPEAGGAILVGTSLAGGTEAGFSSMRRTPSFTSFPTWLGVAVEPMSDQADLRTTPLGFVLAGGAISDEAAVSAQGARRLDLPNETSTALMNRLKAQLSSAAMAAPRGRTRSRLAAAQSMLAMGLGAEAEALLQRAVVDDPDAIDDVRLGFVAAAAAIVAGRPDEAAALDAPALLDDPEPRMWRGLRDRHLGRDTPAARGLSALINVAADYPASLRRLVWPDLAEAAAEAGTPLPEHTLTPFAEALALEHSGKIDDAVAAFTRIATGGVGRDRVRAVVHATELKLASGRVTSGEAADSIEQQTLLWRGDSLELSNRLRAAELRAAAGGWKRALDMLRATDAAFPEQRDTIRGKKAAILEAMLQTDGTKLAPLELVLLVADYADCVPDDGGNVRLAKLLADKLMALDLPARAIPVLQGLVQRTQPGPARAEFGMGLSQLLLDGGDIAGAATTLDASNSSQLPLELSAARAVVAANIQAAQGKPREAAVSLATLNTPAADDLRATLFAKLGDWKEAAEALHALAVKLVPGSGQLPESAQDVIVRQATVGVQLADAESLRELANYLPRMTGAKAEILRLLTETPVTSTRDLPRAAGELKLARSIPKQLQSLAPATP